MTGKLVLVDHHSEWGGGQAMAEFLATARPELAVTVTPRGSALAAAVASGGGVVVEAQSARLHDLRKAIVAATADTHRAVVVANTIPAALAVSALRRRRGVLTLQIVHSNPSSRLRASILRATSRLVDRTYLVASSLYPAVGSAPAAVRLLGPHAADVMDEAALPAAPERAVQFLGRVDEVKGVDLLVEALHHLNARSVMFDAELGLGRPLNARPEHRGAFAEMARAVGATVTYDVSRQWLRPTNILVVPSRSEAACLVAHEAMAKGMVVVASPVGDLPDILGSGRYGVIADRGGDPIALADALEHALALPATDYMGIVRAARSQAAGNSCNLTRLADELHGLVAARS